MIFCQLKNGQYFHTIGSSRIYRKIEDNFGLRELKRYQFFDSEAVVFIGIEELPKLQRLDIIEEEKNEQEMFDISQGKSSLAQEISASEGRV